jgi:hypothetical protein
MPTRSQTDWSAGFGALEAEEAEFRGMALGNFFGPIWP